MNVIGWFFSDVAGQRIAVTASAGVRSNPASQQA